MTGSLNRAIAKKQAQPRRRVFKNGEFKIVSPKEFKEAVKDYLKESKGLI